MLFAQHRSLQIHRCDGQRRDRAHQTHTQRLAAHRGRRSLPGRQVSRWQQPGRSQEGHLRRRHVRSLHFHAGRAQPFTGRTSRHQRAQEQTWPRRSALALLWTNVLSAPRVHDRTCQIAERIVRKRSGRVGKSDVRLLVGLCDWQARLFVYHHEQGRLRVCQVTLAALQARHTAVLRREQEGVRQQCAQLRSLFCSHRLAY